MWGSRGGAEQTRAFQGAPGHKNGSLAGAYWSSGLRGQCDGGPGSLLTGHGCSGEPEEEPEVEPVLAVCKADTVALSELSGSPKLVFQPGCRRFTIWAL